MTDTPAGSEPVTPQFKRGLAFAWVLIVLTVGACIFLGTWWNISGVRREEFITATAAGQLTPTQPEQAARLTAAAMATPLEAGAPPEIAAGAATGTPAPTPTPLPIADTNFGYGVVVNGLAAPDETLDLVQQLGVGWVKQPVRWADVEPQPGSLDWEALDAFFAGAAARNQKVLVTVSAAPEWARAVTAENRDGPPDNPAAYATFISQLMQRYRGGIHAVEIWSEMNGDREWYVAGGLNSSSYMQLLLPAAQAVRAVDPGVLIVSGGLNPTGVDDGILAIDDFRYLRELIDLGMLDYVDCVGVHHKGYNLPPDVPYDTQQDDPAARFREPYDNAHHSWSFYSTLRGYHDLIVAAGRDTPLCVTEFGWPAEGGAAATGDLPAFATDNTPEEQAAFIVQAFELMQEWEFVRLATVSNLDLTLEESERTDADLAAAYRIVGPGGVPRPAFIAVQEMPKAP